MTPTLGGVRGQVIILRVTGQVTILQVTGQVITHQVAGQVIIPQFKGQVTILQVAEQAIILGVRGRVTIPDGDPLMMITGLEIHLARFYPHQYLMVCLHQWKMDTA